jgi:hypothetical protein
VPDQNSTSESHKPHQSSKQSRPRSMRLADAGAARSLRRCGESLPHARRNQPAPDSTACWTLGYLGDFLRRLVPSPALWCECAQPSPSPAQPQRSPAI